jgi:hypothetical protein
VNKRPVISRRNRDEIALGCGSINIEKMAVIAECHARKAGARQGRQACCAVIAGRLIFDCSLD